MDKNKKIHASKKSMVVNAILENRYLFANHEDAREFIKDLKNKFITSSKFPQTEDEIILWIADYRVTKEEFSKGAKGNFCKIDIKQSEGIYILSALKLEIDIKQHPQKLYKKQDHPNWAHPILRTVKKKVIYKTAELAQKQLDELMMQFPKISIPAHNKLFIMIYEKSGIKGEVKKYCLEIKPDENGRYIIDPYINDKSKAKPKALEKPKEPPLGKFTTLVINRRKRKKK